ncbi:MAG: DUF2971 domain-containing protein [Candidatus Poribacteria bacterium]|nr:DUF2971 domain-containing protein [Candidatus Poribacteria bacterium]
MTTQLYRIRSIRHLLGKYKELDKQHIYFATLSELNDPMEGYRDIVWQGDSIVWGNFFRNYISCLNLTIFLAMLNENSTLLTPEEIPIEGFQGDLETPIETSILDGLCNTIFDRCRLQQLICKLSSSGRAVRRGELLIYLKSIHFFAIDEIQNFNFQHGFLPEAPKSHLPMSLPEQFAQIPDLIERLHSEQPNISETAFTALFSAYNLINDNHSLLKKYDYYRDHGGSPDFAQANMEFISLDFPVAYLDQLNRILFPDWYVACFLEDCSNSSVWGHYGDNHRGAALIFDVENKSGDPFMDLYKITGYSVGSGDNAASQISKMNWGYSPMKFYKIVYKSGIDAVDFFRSIGVLPTDRLVKRWYTDHSGNVSNCAHHIGSDIEGSWRETYWNNFLRDISVKSTDWAYEKEYRLILNASFIDLNDKSTRKLKYKFESLNGIVFGINMSDEDKLRIIDIIFKKCRKSLLSG